MELALSARSTQRRRSYVAPFLPPGNYEVGAGKSGFASVLRKELTFKSARR